MIHPSTSYIWYGCDSIELMNIVVGGFADYICGVIYIMDKCLGRIYLIWHDIEDVY